MALKLWLNAWLSIQNHLQVILAWDLKIDFQMFFVGVICDALDKKDMQMRFKSCCWGLEWSIKPTEAMKCHEISPNALFWANAKHKRKTPSQLTSHRRSPPISKLLGWSENVLFRDNLHTGFLMVSQEWLHPLFCVHLVSSDYSTGCE